jgi:hypothetical protein
MIERGFVKRFKKVEDRFSDTLLQYGSTSRSSEEEDINDHWDVKLDVKFDVKAIKKTNRSDAAPNENIHWVEIKNVHGNDGWLYGKADYFSFETEDYWVVVSKDDLQKFISDKCAEKLWSEKPELYKLYRRSGRMDIITLVKTLDLCYIAEKIIKK